VSLFDSRIYAYGLMLVLVGAVVSPAISKRPRDDYPLSTYPMFAEDRGRTATVEQAIGVLRSGERLILPPRYLGTDEVLQAKTKLEGALASGRSDALCSEIAGRVLSDRSDVIEVIIRTITVDTIAYFQNADAATKSERVYARCPVVVGTPV
jgi:hypothetical protein